MKKLFHSFHFMSHPIPFKLDILFFNRTDATTLMTEKQYLINLKKKKKTKNKTKKLRSLSSTFMRELADRAGKRDQEPDEEYREMLNKLLLVHY